MERHIKKRNLKAENFFCIYCALVDHVLEEAEYMIWYEDDSRVMPMCKHCMEAITERDGFFKSFSYN